MIKFRQIQALHAVIETGTVTKAADKLGISQPGVSNLIASLEHHIGFKLFQRISGRLTPTPEANRLFNSVEGIIEGFENIDRRAAALKNETSGKLILGCLPELSLDYIPVLLSKFLKDKPEVEATFQTRSSMTIQEMVADHYIEVGVAEGPLQHENLAGETFSYPCYCALPLGHRLADKKSISAKDLDGEPLISLGSYHMTYHRLREVFSASNCVWNDQYQTRTFYAALTMVREGMGVALVDPFTLSTRDTGHVIIKPFKTPIFLDLAVIWAADQPISMLGQSFVNHLTSAMAATRSTVQTLPLVRRP
ncbi:MAG: DNA-binding transcriptional LysR family regulator [Saprospiraceae bacterium]|jgi:DNA-binding transcriptional LysR family regulator